MINVTKNNFSCYSLVHRLIGGFTNRWGNEKEHILTTNKRALLATCNAVHNQKILYYFTNWMGFELIDNVMLQMLRSILWLINLNL